MSKAAPASSSAGTFVARLIRSSRARRDEYAERIAELEDDVQFWRNLALLLPYAVKIPPPQIPAQRRPLPVEQTYRPRAGRPADLWPLPRPDRFPDRRTGGHL